MTSRERHSDNPAFLLLKALITGQKIFYATADGNVNKKTIMCSDLTSISDQDGNQVHIVDPNNNANGQTRDVTGDTSAGTINVGTAFDTQITEGTAFILTGIRSTPVEVAAFETWVKTAIGDSSGHTLTSLVTKWGDLARSLDLVLGARWDAAGDLGTDIGSIITAIAAVQNNTRFTAAVPVQMCKPDTGNEAFRMASNLYDTEGNMEDPTNNEILVRVIKDDGTYITADLYKDNGFVAVLDNATDGATFPAASGWRAMEREAAGKFYHFFKVANSATEESLTVEFGWTENSKNNYQSRSTEIADVHGDLAELLADVGDASASSLSSIYGVLGNPSASLATTILDGIDGRTNTKTLHGLLGVPDDSGKAIYTNIGDYQAQTNLQTLLAALGIPDTVGKPLYTCLVTDRLDNATHGLAAQDTYHWDKDISAYAGVKAGTYLKTLYDDWLNGGRLDNLLDACSTHTPTNVRQSICLTGDPASSIGKLLFDNLNAPVGSIPTTPTLQGTWTDAKAAFLDEAISAAKTLTVAERMAIRRSVCLTGDTANSIGKILYELYINRLTAARAGYLDELDFDLDARLDTKVAGKQQIAKTTEDLNQAEASYDLFTGATQDVILESLLIRMPNLVAGGALTSISIQTDDATPQVLVSAADGAVANLTVEAQLAWQNFNAPILIKAGTKIQLTIAGGAHGAAYVCDIVAKVRAVVTGGYLT